MIVKAASGLSCPKEDNPRDYITDSEAVTVPDSAYYLRLVDDGSLVIVPAAKPGKNDAPKGGDQA